MALPRSLPPPPTSSTAPASASAKPFDPNALINSFASAYLNMLNKPTENTIDTAVATDAAVAAVPIVPAAESVQLSPEMRELLEFVSPDWAPALLPGSDSPVEETPLFTPMLDFGTPISNVWESSPVFGDNSDFPPLFATAVETLSLDKPETATPEALMNLYTMPTTPALPASASLFPPTPVSVPKANAPNGHRKGVTAASLIPIDAPTQARNYHSESKTSRKVLPAAFANKSRKRMRDEAGLDEDEDLLLTPDLEDAIANKRRQNTIAARRSRARKAETARQHEELISHLTDENTRLRQENEMLRSENEALRRRAGH